MALDGTGSHDADGDPLAYEWTLLSKPADSTAELDNPLSAQPRFVVDKPGTYTIQLIINDGTVDSDPDTVEINTENSKPVADVGPDQQAEVGQQVQLDGSGSSDVDDDPLTFGWSFVAVPDGSFAVLSDPTIVNPTFIPDVAGDYVVQLIVNDGTEDSEPDTALIVVTVSDPNSTDDDGDGFSENDGDCNDTNPAIFPGAAELCNGIDENCNNLIDEALGQVTCGIGACTRTVNACVDGEPQECTPGSPLPEVCNNFDDDCDGEVDEGGVCVVNQPPTITSSPVTAATEGQSYTYDADGTDPDGDPLTFSLPLAPDGMTINAGTGVISWTPGTGQVGQRDVTVRLEDGQGGIDFQTYIIDVAAINEAPTANDDIYEARIGETLRVIAPGVMANDSDPNDDPLEAALVTPPNHGTLDLRTDGSFDYTPTPPSPASSPFAPVLKFAFNDQDRLTVRGAPSVADLDGDSIPELIFRGSRGPGIANSGWFFVIRGDTGEEVHAFDGLEDPDRPFEPDSSGRAAIGDIDGDGRPEIVFPALCHGHILVFEHDLTPKFSTQTGVPGTGACSIGGFQPEAALADLDGDGTPEIVIPKTRAFSEGVSFQEHGLRVYDNQGQIFWEIDLDIGDYAPEVADVDLDGKPEIIFGKYLLSHDGQLLWENQPRTADRLRTAAVNLDDDAFAEIVYTANQGGLWVLEHDGSVKWDVSTNADFPNRGSHDAPLVTDFDNDGEPEIGVMKFGEAFTVFEADGTLKWQTRLAAPDGSNPKFGGAAVFDFEGDGIPEVALQATLFSEQEGLHFLRGDDGTELLLIPNTIAPGGHTQINTQPIVADIDGDGHSELAIPVIGIGAPRDSIQVYEAANDDWQNTRPIWNQFTYHVTNVNGDLTIPAQERPNWLTPGLNNAYVNALLPEEREGRADSFTYKDNDGEFDSNVATAHIEILPPGNPPQILSQPDITATVGFLYPYQVFAVDPDVGDVLTFGLSSAPAGMSINPATGAITWTPTDAQEGQHQVGIIVSDTQGFTALQAYTLTVGQPVLVPDVVGQLQATAEAAITGANLTVGTVITTTSATVPAGAVISQSPVGGAVAEFGEAVNMGISSGPAPGDIDNDGDGFSPNQGDCNDGNGSIFPGAADSEGNGVDENCDGVDGVLSITSIVIEPANPTILVGQSIAFNGIAVLDNGTSLNLTTLGTWQSQQPAITSVNAMGTATGSTPGSATIDLSHLGVTGSTTLTVVASVAGDQTPPVAEITAPAANSTITEPVDIVGTATDANFLKYELAIAPAGETTFTIITTSTTPVSNGVLGQFDPTLLLNDLYTVRLTVFDQGGNVSTAETVYQVDENMKVGNFTLTFTDLSIPMSGIPITVTRTYDSRDKRMGDFGVGWRLDVQTLICRANRVLGTGWQVVQSGLSFVLVPTDEHKVSITLPGGRVEEFDLVISPTVSPLVPFPPFANRTSFRPRPGTLGTLVSLDNNNLTILDPQPGIIELLDDVTNNTYNPQRFKYTAADGTEIVIHKINGIESVKDPNGNTLTFGPSGITHSAGKSVVFQRDAEGRVTQLTDPNGNSQTYTYDANGDLTSHTDAEGNTTSFLYNRTHGLIKILDPLGNNAVRNEYDDNGRLIATIDALGNRVEFTHDIAGRQETQTDPRGNAQVILYDDNGNVLSRERVVTIEGVPVVVRETFEYDAFGNETARVDADGTRTEMSYDARQNVTQTVVDPGGLNIVTSATYDGRDNPLTQTDALGNVTRFKYDARGNPTEIIDPLGNTTKFTYDTAGRVIVQEDALGNKTLTDYTAFGQIETQERRNAQGQLFSRAAFTYDNNGKVLTDTTFREVNGVLTPLTTTFTYDSNDRRTSTTDPLGNIPRVEYDANDKVAARIDARGNRTEFTYDARGLLIRTDFPDGTATRTEYDAAGNRLKSIDQLGRETTFEYDELNRLVKTTFPDNTTNESVLTPGGRLAASIDAKDNRIDFVYDAAGRRTRTLLPQVMDGATGTLVRPEITEAYDKAGQRTVMTDANGELTQFDYDNLGRLTEIIFPDLSEQKRTYDALSRLATQTDEETRTTVFTYDGRDRLTSVTLPPPRPGDPSPVTTYTYDTNGNRLTQTDALGRTTRFTYDERDRLSSRTLPGGQAETFGYDPNGNVTSLTDFNGNTITLEYDALNRIVSRRFPDNSEETITYTATGQRETVTDTRGVTTFVYDTRDRLQSVLQPDGQNLTYTYDTNGNLETLTANGSRTTTYEYDALNRLTNVVAPEGVTTHAYDPAGNRIRTVAPNGVVTTTLYDDRNRVTRLVHEDSSGSVLESFDYTFTPSGLRKTVTEVDGSVETYDYDDLNRLVTETRTGTNPRTLVYEYDLVGNRTRLVRDGVETLYTYDPNNRLLTENGTLYSYDANGNRLSKTSGGNTTSYSWDFKDKLVEVVTPTGATRYTYDADGNRVRKETPSQSVSYLVDTQNLTGFTQVLAERDAGGNTLAAYTYGDDLLALDRQGAERFYQYDAHGNTQLLTDNSSNVTDTYDYESYGNLVNQTGITDNDYRYTGEQFDAEADAYYLRARYYDPDAGVFLSKDPATGNIDDPMSLQGYQYAEANPVNLIDPSGRITLPELSLVQVGQNELRNLDLIAKTSRFCSGLGTLRTAQTVVTLSHLFFAVAPNIANIASGDIFSPLKGKKVAISQRFQPPIEVGANEFDTASIEAEIGKQLEAISVKLKLSEGRIRVSEVEGDAEGTDNLALTFSVDKSGTFKIGGNVESEGEFDIASLTACGFEVAKLSFSVAVSVGAELINNVAKGPMVNPGGEVKGVIKLGDGVDAEKAAKSVIGFGREFPVFSIKTSRAEGFAGEIFGVPIN